MTEAKKDLGFYCRVVEALIFASPTPVSERTIRQHLPNAKDTSFYERVMGNISKRYDDSSGIELCQLDNHWAFRTRLDIGDHLRSLRQHEKSLSRAAIETLAIIAYHQPITRAEIEAIRGVTTSKGTLDTLLELGWIQPKGRRNTPGRPLTWRTSADFLDHFGLSSLDALPGLEELKKAQLVTDSARIHDLPQANSLPLMNGAVDDSDNTSDNNNMGEGADIKTDSKEGASA
ncbi:MAG: SMC-Scp complex subunit ScpB [Proteobacteria bacterium]|nr:SMC-Scp complex subunit ScpB [Pseudomonadota bacterium]